MNKNSRSHDGTVIELLREDPAFAVEYLVSAMEEVHLNGGREAFLAALRHIAEARCTGSDKIDINPLNPPPAKSKIDVYQRLISHPAQQCSAYLPNTSGQTILVQTLKVHHDQAS